MLQAVVVVIIVWVAVALVDGNVITFGQTYIFITLIQDLFKPTKRIIKQWNEVGKIMASAERIGEVLDRKPDVEDQPGAFPAPELRGNVEFRNVSFAYQTASDDGGPPQLRLALRDVSFTIAPGEVVALVGGSGAGKSTVVQLLPRLYDPSDGKVMIDGHDIRAFTLNSLRSRMSMVLQEAILFVGTVAENIAYGRPNATREEIIAAAMQASAHDFIEKLPKGYDTILSERASNLSGGQRQRIAIARAFIRNTPVLILDEPTTGLDAESTELVQLALRSLMKGKATIIISHDLNLIRQADKIVVVKDGQVEQVGSHKALLKAGGLYADLYYKQFGAVVQEQGGDMHSAPAPVAVPADEDDDEVPAVSPQLFQTMMTQALPRSVSSQAFQTMMMQALKPLDPNGAPGGVVAPPAAPSQPPARPATPQAARVQPAAASTPPAPARPATPPAASAQPAPAPARPATPPAASAQPAASLPPTTPTRPATTPAASKPPATPAQPAAASSPPPATARPATPTPASAQPRAANPPPAAPDKPAAPAPHAPPAHPAIFETTVMRILPDAPAATAAPQPPKRPTVPDRLAGVQIDPLSSPILRKELPGVEIAFNEQKMLDQLQAVLFGKSNPNYTIESCKVDQAAYPAADGCLLHYKLSIYDKAHGRNITPLVSARIFPNQIVCAVYMRDRLAPVAALMRGREEVAPYLFPVTMIEPLNMVIHIFPIDGDLPTLAGATDRRRMAEILGEVLSDGQDEHFAVEQCQVELVDYARWQRCTLRYHIEGRWADGGQAEQRTVYGKVFADNTGALSGPATEALRAYAHNRNGYQFNIPRLLAWRPDLKLALLEAIPGEPVLGKALRARLRGEPAPAGVPTLEEMIDGCAKIAAALHTSNIKLGRRRTFDDEMTALHQELTPILRVSPELGAQLQEWMGRLQAYAEESDPLRPRFSHGDFTHGQVIFDGAASGLVDFDGVCQAEPALDLGQFLTYLRLVGRKGEPAIPPAPGTPLDQLGERFLNSYIAASGNQIEDVERLRVRISAYQVISSLRRTMRSWQKIKASRLEHAVAILKEEIACLPQLDY